MSTGKDESLSQKEDGSVFSRFLARIGGVFLAPDATFRQITIDRVGFWEPFLLVLATVGISTAVLASFFYRVAAAITDSLGSLGGGFGFGFLGGILLVLCLIVIVAALLFWVIIAGIAHISAKHVFRGQGSFVQLLKLYGYSILPCSLQLLGTVLVGLSWMLLPMLAFFHVIAVFWVVVLMTVAVRQNYGIDTGKAFISSFVGPMTICLLFSLFSWIWMWTIMNSFAGGFG